ncbi:MAG: glycosyltransferase, partial [Clostridia bacterium]|nr:glycosyltransferase [Clostridia bacterium]
YWVADAIEMTGAELLYSDEDKVQHDGKYLFTPHLKPDYSPDLLRSCNYFCHLMVLKTDLLKRIGGLQAGFDGSQDHELALRAAENAKGVYHIPRVLYHWRQDANSMSHRNMEKCLDAGKRAVEAQLAREGLMASISFVRTRNRVLYHLNGEPWVTVILWCNQDTNRSGKCLSVIQDKADYDNLEVITVHGENRALAYNQAAAKAKGDYLIFMDSDTYIATPGWIRQWLGYCQREKCLSVCGKMTDKRNKLIFAGYVVGVGAGVEIPQKGLPADSWGYFGIKEMTHNVSAASWAAMMVKKETFLQLEGFDTSLPALADVDWCLRASKATGAWHTYDPYLKIKTGGKGLWLKYAPSWDPFLQKWPNLQDPYYNPQWSRQNANYRLK